MATKLSLTGITFPDTTVQTTAASGGGLGGITVFTSNGTFTIPAGKTVVKVTVVGAGGAGGGASFCNGVGSAGGGGGGTAIKYLTGLTPGNTLTVTRGAGAGSSAGGTSSVASGTQTISTISATGGGAGGVPFSAGYSSTGGSGGVGSGGDYNLTGGTGDMGNYGSCGPPITYGGGGNSFLGAKGPFKYDPSYDGEAGQLYGGGGTGRRSTGLAGGNGIIIFEY